LQLHVARCPCGRSARRSLTARNVAPKPAGALESSRALVTTRGAALQAMLAPLAINASTSATSSFDTRGWKPPTER
jgi:hypothetical protein